MAATVNALSSAKLYEKSCEVIPGGVNSPVRAFKEIGLLPFIVERGEGDTIFDHEGNPFIDYCMSWGSLILGHAHPKIVKAVQSQMEKGSSFGIATELEFLIASKVARHVPSIEKVRFVSSGTEATMSALRLARGYTGRSKFIKFNGNYHGHADPFLVQAGSGVSYLPSSSSLGVPLEGIKNTISLPYNDEEAIRSAFRQHKDIAAVIVEPLAANMGLVPGSIAFLETLRLETEKAGALLIFDEVVSGFRVGLGGVQEKVGVIPDLTCLGKIVGGGLPAAAFGGKKEIMDLLAPLGAVYQAGTLSGNPLAMASGLASLEELEKPDFYKDLEEKTNWFLAPIEELIRKKDLNMTLNREGSCFTLFFGPKKVTCSEDLKELDQEAFKSFYRFLLDQGVYFSPSSREANFISASHKIDSLEKTQEAILAFLFKRAF